MEPTQIVMLVALIISVIMHEMAHGYAANWLGDPTARLAGRLTANPISHIDPMMSVILPGLLLFSGSPILFGAAKPVPYNPYNFNKHQRWGEAIVAAAGPAANIAIAVIFGLIVRSAEALSLSATFVEMSLLIIMLNIFLALFNLVPIPPLDGSKILPKFLPRAVSVEYDKLRMWFEGNPLLGFGLVIFTFITVLSEPLYNFTVKVTFLLAGL